MSSQLILGQFDLLDTTGQVILTTGFDRGMPVPTVSQIQSTVLDGAAVVGRAAGNRRIVLPLLIRTPDRLTASTVTNQLLATVDQPTFTLQFTPDGGMPVVYDCFRAAVQITSDLRQEADGWQAVTVSCDALPYGRSPTPQTVTLSGSSTQVEGFNSSPEPVAVTGLLGTVKLVTRATSPAYEGAGSLEVDYVSSGGAVQLRASNSVALAAPTGLTAAAVASGGSFAAATYYWKITAINDHGETLPSAEASVAIVLNGSATLSWTAVTGATGYRIYRATAAGGESTSPALVGSVGIVTSYTDTGAATTAGSVPSANTTGLSVSVGSALSVASIQVQVPTAAALTATGNWTLTLATSAGSFTKTQSSGPLPGNGAWSAVSFDMSAVPVGATITGWTLTTPTIRQTSATPATKVSFAYTGAVQTFTVPANVYSVVVDLSGAGCGDTSIAGGRVKGVLPATPGDVWNIYVGGRGAAPSGLTGGAGGYNAGGDGGGGTGANGGGGYGGGGASDIRIGGTAVGYRKVLAGGAGGDGGGGLYAGLGGNGGAATGGTGQTGTTSPSGNPGAGGGGGGTQVGPGSGGASSGAAGQPGSAGAAGNSFAGNGGTATGATNSFGGGGGGGGYWSGGGGGACGIMVVGNPGGGGGGGAGSNYTGGLSTVTLNSQGGGGSYNGSISISYQTTDKIFFDDLRIYPTAVGGVADAYGGTYTLPNVLGTARTPINVALTKSGGGTFAGWIVHTPPADPPTAQELIPLGGASGVAYTTAASVRYNGTYSVWLAAGTFAGGAVSRTWTVTATQSLPSGGPNTSTALTVTPSTNNQLYYVGEITLPITQYPPEASVTTTITVTSTQTADTFLDVLLLDTRGQTIAVDNTAAAQANAWIDEPTPTQALGGVWSGSARTSATSLTSKLLAATALIQNPGSSQVLLYSPGGSLAATVTYSPRWLQEATA